MKIYTPPKLTRLSAREAQGRVWAWTICDMVRAGLERVNGNRRL